MRNVSVRQVLAVRGGEPHRDAGGGPLHRLHPAAPRQLVQVRRPRHHQSHAQGRAQQRGVSERRTPFTFYLCFTRVLLGFIQNQNQNQNIFSRQIHTTWAVGCSLLPVVAVYPSSRSICVCVCGGG